MRRKNPILVIASTEDGARYRDFPLPDEEFVIIPYGQAICSMIFRDVDLVLLDCGFDTRLGVEVLTDLKQRFTGIPVLFLSDQSSEDLVINVFRRGARDFIRKPFEVFLLREQITKLLRAKRSAREIRGRLDNAQELKQADGNLCGAAGLSAEIMKVVCYLEKNYIKSLPLSELASMANMSKAHFCRTFKDQVGMTPVRYLKYVRVQRAKQLLHNYSLTIAATAYRVGFCDVSNFNKNFRQFVGVSPTAYRRSLSSESSF